MTALAIATWGSQKAKMVSLFVQLVCSVTMVMWFAMIPSSSSAYLPSPDSSAIAVAMVKRVVSCCWAI